LEPVKNPKTSCQYPEPGFKRPILRSLSREWCELEFSNKIVLLIGFVLFLELLFAVFWGGEYNWKTISFRTSLGAIMGYVIGGMGSASVEKPEQPVATPTAVQSETPVSPVPADAGGDCLPDSRSIQSMVHLRNAVAGFVCLTSVVVLFLINITGSENTFAEGVLQIRDMMSTTLGFLISASGRKK